MDIEHLGEAVIDQLVDRRLVRDFADLYRLRPADLEPLAGFGPKSTRNLLDAIAASRGRGLARLLNALGSWRAPRPTSWPTFPASAPPSRSRS
jgi:DNA ligase (NAD+)